MSESATPGPQQQQARKGPEVPKIKSRMSWQPYPNLPALLRLIPNLFCGASTAFAQGLEKQLSLTYFVIRTSAGRFPGKNFNGAAFRVLLRF